MPLLLLATLPFTPPALLVPLVALAAWLCWLAEVCFALCLTHQVPPSRLKVVSVLATWSMLTISTSQTSAPSTPPSTESLALLATIVLLITGNPFDSKSYSYSIYKQKFKAAHDREFELERDADFSLYHSPYTKLVRRSFARTLYGDYMSSKQHLPKPQIPAVLALPRYQRKSSP